MSLVGSTHHPVSVAWADRSLSPADDKNSEKLIRNDEARHQQQTATDDQHKFRMRIFQTACSAYDF